jgi:hypothetical protein
MSQQTPSLRLRKDFLVVGLILLLSSFFFFYWASRVDWDYVKTYNDTVNLLLPTWSNVHPAEYYVRDVTMQPNDLITVSYPESTEVKGAIQIVLLSPDNYSVILASSDNGFLSFTNQQPAFLSLSFLVCLIVQYIQNATLTITTELNHYETPHWIYFGTGMVLSSLAVIAIFKSKKEAQTRVQKGTNMREKD